MSALAVPRTCRLPSNFKSQHALHLPDCCINPCIRCQSKQNLMLLLAYTIDDFMFYSWDIIHRTRSCQIETFPTVVQKHAELFSCLLVIWMFWGGGLVTKQSSVSVIFCRAVLPPQCSPPMRWVDSQLHSCTPLHRQRAAALEGKRVMRLPSQRDGRRRDTGAHTHAAGHVGSISMEGGSRSTYRHAERQQLEVPPRVPSQVSWGACVRACCLPCFKRAGSRWCVSGWLPL